MKYLCFQSHQDRLNILASALVASILLCVKSWTIIGAVQIVRKDVEITRLSIYLASATFALSKVVELSLIHI